MEKLDIENDLAFLQFFSPPQVMLPLSRVKLLYGENGLDCTYQDYGKNCFNIDILKTNKKKPYRHFCGLTETKISIPPTALLR